MILNIEHNDEKRDDGWIEGEGLLSGLVQLRDDILRGDWRTLYLAWLKIAHSEVEMLEADEDLIEPSVPPNLQRLSPALRHFITFLIWTRIWSRLPRRPARQPRELTKDLAEALIGYPKQRNTISWDGCSKVSHIWTSP